MKNKFANQIENLKTLIKTTKNEFKLEELENNEMAVLVIGKDAIKTGYF